MIPNSAAAGRLSSIVERLEGVPSVQRVKAPAALRISLLLGRRGFLFTGPG